MDPPKAEGGGASCSSGQSWSPGVGPRLLNVLVSSRSSCPPTGVLSPTSCLSPGSTTKLSTLSDSNDEDEDEGNYVNVQEGLTD